MPAGLFILVFLALLFLFTVTGVATLLQAIIIVVKEFKRISKGSNDAEDI